jgi:pilus assembly protein CpaB
MGESQNRLALFGAIGLALLAAIFAFAALRAAGGGGGDTAVGGVDVVVATQRIEPGTVINDDMFAIKSIPDDALIANHLTTLEGLTGLVARVPIEQGEQLTESKVGQLAEEGIPGVTPPGMRAFAVEVTEEKIFGGLLAPGNHVDVIAVVSRTVGDDDITEARFMAQNAEVLAVADVQLEPVAQLDRDGNVIQAEDSEGVLSESPDDVDAQPEATSVTLALTPGDTLLVALAQEEGSLWLSVRPHGDDSRVDEPARTLDDGAPAGGDGSSGAGGGGN